MKTIEEAALNCNKEYSLQPAPAYLGFIQGVKFAQEWISVEEEEPPLYITVLVKLFNGRFFTAKYIKSSKCREDDVWSDGFSYYPVNDTHWRPIELK